MTAFEIAKADWPEFGLVDDLRPALFSAFEAREHSVLVTLHSATGGAPRGIGAQMLVTQRAISGYLSGGCIEPDVTHHALAALADGSPRRMVYGQGGPIDIRLPCGGRIELLAERISPGDPALHDLFSLTARRQPAAWVTTGEVRGCAGEDADVGHLSPDLRAAFLHARQVPEIAGCHAQTHTVYRRFEPRQRFVVLGCDPTTLAMAMVARKIGMEVVLVRPNGPSKPPPIPGIRYLRQRPGAALAKIRLDPWTAVAVAMHQEDDDHEALVAALPSPASYVGLLGSSRFLPNKLARLIDAGVSAHDIARLKAPIGLDVGGHSPWQIAMSVMAEIIQTTNALRARKRSSVQAA
ncbi:XdhC family protein [Microvirga sp. BT350]|uniref:XdhC family protein n=2 Tax=Microvirga alba TaxID=2791025 RepID=A0A931FPQ7_9HYPH|nr:XdhC family protein [Microvirga alba]